MERTQSSTEIAEPTISHENWGWRRRGVQRKSSVTAAAMKTIPRGQRTIDHAFDNIVVEPRRKISLPKVRQTNASVVRVPALSAKTKASEYFFATGRSCSTP